MTVNEAISEFERAYADIAAALPAPLSAEREVVYFDKNFSEVSEDDSTAVSVSLDVFVCTSARERLTVLSLLFDFRDGVILDKDAAEQISERHDDARLFIDELLTMSSPEDFVREAILKASEELERFEADIHKTLRRTKIFSFIAILVVAVAVVTTAVVLLVR